MSAPKINRWIGAGLLGLPLYGALTFWSSMNPQPDPNTRFEAWSRYVTTDHYVLCHMFGSILGLIFALFGTFALGAYLAGAAPDAWAWWAMVMTVSVVHASCRRWGCLRSPRPARGWRISPV